MSAPPPISHGTDPIILPGATVLPLGADPPAEEARFHDDESLADTLEQALTKRDKTHFMLGFERGFVAEDRLEGGCICLMVVVRDRGGVLPFIARHPCDQPHVLRHTW